MLRIFTFWKNPSTSVGFEPANFRSRGEHVTPRPLITHMLFWCSSINFTKLMKGIQNCLLFFPICSQLEMSQRTHVACNKHAAPEATCHLGDMSLLRQCEPVLSPPFNFHVSVRVCLLRDISYDMSRTICRGSVNTAHVTACCACMLRTFLQCSMHLLSSTTTWLKHVYSI